MGDVGFDPVNSRHWHNVTLTLSQRLLRWFNINASLVYLPEYCRQEVLCWTIGWSSVGRYSVKGSGPTLNQCSSCEHAIAVFYLLISHSLIPWPLSQALSQRWGIVTRAKSARPQSLNMGLQTHGVHAISVTDRDRTEGHLCIDLTLSSRKSDDGGGHRNGRT